MLFTIDVCRNFKPTKDIIAFVFVGFFPQLAGRLTEPPISCPSFTQTILNAMLVDGMRQILWVIQKL